MFKKNNISPIKNHNTLVTGLILSIFLIQIFTLSLVFPKNESTDFQSILVPPLRGGEFFELNYASYIKNDGEIDKVSETPSLSDNSHLNPFNPINSKIRGTGGFIEDYVDNQNSDVDSVPDLGTLTDFNNMKASDSSYSNFSETAATGEITVTDVVVEDFNSPTATSHTLSLSAASAGDLRVVIIAANPDGTGSVPTINLPSGWNWIGTQEETGALSNGMLGIIYRVVQGGDASTLATTYTQTCIVASIAVTYEGVDTTTPLDQTIPSYATGTGNPVSPDITTQTDNAWVGRAALLDGAPFGFGDTSYPTGTTLRGTMVNNPPSNGQNLGFADEILAIAGAAGTATWTDGGTEEYVAATFALRPATGSTDYNMDQEVQFEEVYKSALVSEELRIKTGTFGGTENLSVSYWDGASWQFMANLTASSWNNLTISDISVTEPLFTIKFEGGTTLGDTTQDWWMIDAILVYVEQFVVETVEDYVDNQDSDIDSVDDLGVLTDFVNLTASDNNYANFSEETVGWVYNTHSRDLTGGYLISDYDMTLVAGTVSFWVQYDAFSGRAFGLNTDMEVRLVGSSYTVDWGGIDTFTTSASYTTGTWYYNAIAWDETANDLFWYTYTEGAGGDPILDTNGAGLWTDSVSGLSWVSTFIGNGKGASEIIDGNFDDIRFYDTAKTLSEITNDYNKTLDGTESNLVAYYRLDNDLTDSVSGGNDLTTSGSSAFSTDVPSGMTNDEGDYNSVVLNYSPDYRWELDGDETDSVGVANSDGGTDPNWVTSIIPNGTATQSGDYNGTANTNIPNQNDINSLATTLKSISIWFQADTIDTTGNGQAIWSEGGSSTALVIYVYLDGSTPKLYFSVVESSGSVIDYISFNISTSALYHVVCTMDTSAGTLYMYLNGVQVANKTGGLNIGSDFDAHTAGLAIGGIETNLRNHNGDSLSGEFDGRIADVVYYAEQTILDEVAAAAIYIAGKGIPTGYQFEHEVQFVGVYDSPILEEQLNIKTGVFGGSENLTLTYWNGSSWKLISSSLTASAWNNFTVSLTSPTFTLKFNSSSNVNDIVKNSWQIDAVFLTVESPEAVLEGDSGFIWLDIPNEVNLGTTYSSWVQQDLSDDNVPSHATGVILAWVEDGTTTNRHAVARGSEDTNDYMNGGLIYNEIEEETWRMQVVKLSEHKYIDTWRQSSSSRLYVLGYTVGADPQFRRVAADLGSLTANSSWNKLTVTDVDENTTGVILFGQSTSISDATILVRAVGSMDSMTLREWEEYNSGALFVKIDANDQFEYYISGGSAKFFLIAEVNDSIDWLTTSRNDISAITTGWTIRDLVTELGTVPLITSGVILQQESTGTTYDYRNIAREYGQTWTFPDYDVGGDQWMMSGSGIDDQNQIQIYAENTQQDVYIHALTLFIDKTAPIINTFGVDDPGTDTATFWVNLTDRTRVDNVTLTVNGTDYQMSNNGTYWTKDLTVQWQQSYTYQISNTSDIFGNFITTPSNEQNHTFTSDAVVPTVIDWEYHQGADGTWDNQNNTFIVNISDSWGEIDTVILEVTTYSLTAVMVFYHNFSNNLGFINNTLDLPNGGIDFRIIVNDTSSNEFTSSTHSDSVFYNHPPVASDLMLSSIPYFSNTSLVLDYDYTDEDSHPESGTEIRWYQNGSLQGTYNDTLVVSADDLFDGDEWYATVRPKDNTLFGQINTSSTITIINTPPEASNVIIIPSNPVTTSNLVVDYDYDDYDGNSENVSSRQIEWYKVGTGHLSVFDNMTSLSSTNTIEGEEYYVRIRVHDNETYSIWVTSPSIIIGNSIPNAVNLSLPLNPTNVTDLVATWDMQDDDVGDTENKSAVIIYWYKNGVLQPLWNNSAVVGSGNTSKGQIWWSKIQVYDGEQYSALTELLPHVEILNSIPVVGNVSISTSNPYTIDDLMIGNWNYTDDDNDTEGAAIIHWYLDDILQSGYNGFTTLPASATSKGENWHVGIQTYDGTAYSVEVNSSKILILNSLPEVDNLIITLTPTTTDDLIASWTYTDDDTDSLTFNVTWYLNNVFNTSWLITTSSATLNAGNTSKYLQQWYYTVQADDGENYSSIVSLGSNVTIQNSKPTVTNPTFNDTTPADAEDFNIIYSFLDADGDLENKGELIVYWYVNWDCLSQFQNYTTIYNQNTSQTEVWYYILRVFDGEDYSINITSETGVLIGGGSNDPPKAENLTLAPSTPLTIDDLTADYDYSDPESKPQIAFEITWYMNNVSQPQHQTLTIPASATAKGQQWNFTIRVFDGLQWSELNSSQIFIIGNTNPQVSGLGASVSKPTTTNDLVVSWSSFDDDSDALTFNVTWILNGAINSSWLTTDHFTTLNAGNTTKGDNWNVTIEAYDGEAYSSIISLGTNITILNTIPIVENLTLTSLPKTDDDLAANWDFFDIDSDSENTSASIIYWYKNGDLQPLLTNFSTIGSENTSKGQVWWFKIQVYDFQNYSILYELTPHVEIQNTAPVNISFLPIPSTPSVESEIDLSLLSVLSAFSDADGDTIDLTEIRWYKDGILQVNLNNSLSVSGSKLTKGENWSYTVVVFDSVDYGLISLSPKFQILNSHPNVISAYFTLVDAKTTHNLPAAYLYEDADSESISVSEIRWYRSSDFPLYINYFLNSTYDGILTLPNSATAKNERWKFNITITDGYNDSFWKLSDYVEIENSKPWIDPYSITLAGGLNTSDPIIVTYFWYDDDLGDTQSGTTFVWENSTKFIPQDNTLEAIYTKAGESWSVSITPNDGFESGQPINSKFYGVNILIGNTPPEITGDEIKIQGYNSINSSYSNGSSFGTNLDLVLRYNVTDIDGLQGVVLYDVELEDGYALGSEYHWFRNRSGEVTLITALNGMTTVPSTFTERDDLWWVEIKPRDWQGDFGTAKNSTKISITNTAPYISSLSWDKTSFYTRDDLSFDYVFTDYDQSDIELGTIIEWYRDGTNQSGFYNFVSISSQNLTKGEDWFARIKVWDGELYSVWHSLLNISILNTAPVASNVLLNPDSPTSSEDLVVSWDYIDDDDDGQQTPRFRWYKNNLLQINLNDLNTVNSSDLSKNDFWYVTVEAFDGENYSLIITSSSLTILNSPPILTNIVLWNNNDNSNTSFSDGSISIDYFNYTDADNDAVDTGTMFIQWYRNGTHQPLLDNQTTISSNFLQKGDSWVAFVQIIEIEEIVWSNNLTSQTILIINKAPAIIEFIYVGNEYSGIVVEDETINISVVLIDPDINDTDSSFLEWYLNGVYQPQFNNMRIIGSDETTPGDIWIVKVIPSDGIDNGTVDQLDILIESRPFIQDFSVVVEQDIDGHFTFSLKVNDSRNDVLSVVYSVFLNGTELDVLDTIDSANATGFWVLDYYLSDPIYYNTETVILVSALSNISVRSIEIFNYTVIDGVAPRVSKVGLGVRFVKNSDDPTQLSFYADIEEYGSGVANVILYYYYQNLNDGGQGSTLLQEFTQVLMAFNGTEDNILIYAVTVPYPQDGEDYEVLYWVSTQDLEGNSNPVAFDIRDDPDRITNDRIIRPTGLPEWVLLVAGLAVFFIFIGSVVYVRFIRKPELVGLDKELVTKNIENISEAQISGSLDSHTIGVVVSLFDQAQGPIPIIVIPEILKDNFSKLLELSDRSFSGTGFADTFDVEIPSSYDFVLDQGVRISVMSFGFSLERPQARGGKENLTVNILIHQDVYPLLNQFQDEVKAQVHKLHMLMNDPDTSGDKNVIRAKVFGLRKYITVIALSYQELYGTTDLLSEEDE